MSPIIIISLSFFSEWNKQALDVIKASPLVSTHSLLLLNQIRLQTPLSPFHLLLAGVLKDSHIAYSHSPVSYGAVGTGAAHQYAKPRHQNKLCLPEHLTSPCGLLLPYLTQLHTINTGILWANLNTDSFTDTVWNLFLNLSPLTHFVLLISSQPTRSAMQPIVFPEQIF